MPIRLKAEVSVTYVGSADGVTSKVMGAVELSSPLPEGAKRLAVTVMGKLPVLADPAVDNVRVVVTLPFEPRTRSIACTNSPWPFG